MLDRLEALIREVLVDGAVGDDRPSPAERAERVEHVLLKHTPTRTHTLLVVAPQSQPRLAIPVIPPTAALFTGLRPVTDALARIHCSKAKRHSKK